MKDMALCYRAGVPRDELGVPHFDSLAQIQTLYSEAEIITMCEHYATDWKPEFQAARAKAKKDKAQRAEKQTELAAAKQKMEDARKLRPNIPLRQQLQRSRA